MKRDAKGPPEERGSEHVVEVLRTEMAWNGTPYQAYPSGRPELTVLRFALPPHSSLPWHEHVVPSAAFVIAGSITLEVAATGDTRTVNAGEAFGESVGTVHKGSPGARRPT